MWRPWVRNRDEARSDAGVTLVELVVAMSIMAIFFAIFTGAMLSMYHTTNKVQAVTDSSAQISTAISRLDSSLRYASAISPPVTGTDGNPYVAWQTTANGSTQCSQLRIALAPGQLQLRTWTVQDGKAMDTTGWQPLASEITTTDPATGDPLTPFTFYLAYGAAQGSTSYPVATSAPNEQLQVRIVATSGEGSQQASALTDVTFTAFNSGVATPTTGICQEWGTP